MEDYRIGIVTQIDQAFEYDTPVAIVQRKAHWQKFWPMQWADQPIRGRVRNHVDEPWTYALIVQYRPGQMKWRTAESRWYQFAEVQQR